MDTTGYGTSSAQATPQTPSSRPPASDRPTRSTGMVDRKRHQPNPPWQSDKPAKRQTLDVPRRLASRPHQAAQRGPQSPHREPDKRIFIRLRLDSDYRQHDDRRHNRRHELEAIRERAAAACQLPKEAVRFACDVASGVALKPLNDEYRQAILGCKSELCLAFAATRVDDAQDWNHGRNAHPTPDRPRPVSLNARSDGVQAQTTKKEKMQQCRVCWDWHKQRRCQTQKCRNCGQLGHWAEACEETIPRCCNCLGPWPADHPDCTVKRKEGGNSKNLTRRQKKSHRKGWTAVYLKARDEARRQEGASIDQTTTDHYSAYLGAIVSDDFPDPTGPTTSDSEESDQTRAHGKRKATKQESPETLTVFQANVRCSKDIHEAALAEAQEMGADVILIQDPFVHRTKPSTTCHWPHYRTRSPQSEWSCKEDGPGVITYISEGLEANTDDVPLPSPTRDAVGTMVLGQTIINVYRRPAQNHVLKNLFQWPVPNNTLIAGDFNSIHLSWQPGVKPNWLANDLSNWIDDSELHVLNNDGQATYNKGNVLDLVISNISGAEARVRNDKKTGSDHSTLVTTIPLQFPKPTPKRQWYVGSSDIPAYGRFVKMATEAKMLPDSKPTSPQELDRLADSIIVMLQAGIMASTPTAPSGVVLASGT